MSSEQGTCVRVRGRMLAAAALASALLSFADTGRAAVDEGKFRVCADPDNLPFSSETGPLPGIYIEAGAVIANEIGRSFEPVWSHSYFGKRSVRTTLLAGTCDAYIGLPAGVGFMGPRVIVSQSLFDVSYAIAAPKSLSLRNLNDLSGKRIAVQFGSPPQSLLAERDNVTLVTVREPDQAMRALVEGRADAAFIWGPVAGFVNHTALGDAYQVMPVAGPGLTWKVAIGFAPGSEALRDQTNRALAKLYSRLVAFAAKYGWPTEPPITLATSSGVEPRVVLAGETELQQAAPASSHAEQAPPQSPPPAQATNAAPAPAAPGAATQAATATAGGAAAGREIFNGTCAHCHGPDAVQSERKINLRLLHHRYGDRMDQVFLTTVTRGRPDKGMPNWSGVFSEEDFGKILDFLHTVQEND